MNATTTNASLCLKGWKIAVAHVGDDWKRQVQSGSGTALVPGGPGEQVLLPGKEVIELLQHLPRRTPRVSSTVEDRPDPLAVQAHLLRSNKIVRRDAWQGLRLRSCCHPCPELTANRHPELTANDHQCAMCFHVLLKQASELSETSLRTR